MLNLMPYMFPAIRTLKLSMKAINITASANPITFSKNVTLVVIGCCAPPPLKLAAHCVSAGSLLAASCIAPNPITIGSFTHVITELYDECL